jgi:aminoglycoside 3-N-acetyltransferase
MGEDKKYTGNPVLFCDLQKQLNEIGVKKGMSIITHVSLSKIGWIMGGPETLIRSLIDAVGNDGNIMMPAQTWKNLDPSTGVHWEQPEAWWDIIRKEWPAYDKMITPVIGMGIAAEMFRTWPGTERSDHPARSICARGPKAEYLTENHDLENIFGEGSPLAKLYELDGYILLIGVKHNKNTSLHLAETRAEFKGKKMSKESSAISINGKREWVTYQTLAVEDSDFETLGAEFEKENLIVTHKIGNADAVLISQRQLVDWAVAWMEKNR